MKTCLICGSLAPDEAETCASCGEASWGEADGTGAKSLAEAEAPATQQPQGKRRK